jgi:hypothetical protein
MRLFSIPALYGVSQVWRQAAIDMGLAYSLVDLAIRRTTSMPKKKSHAITECGGMGPCMLTPA